VYGGRVATVLADVRDCRFELPLPDDGADKRRHGYSRDQRGDCVR